MRVLRPRPSNGAPRGLMRRHERSTWLIVGAGIVDLQATMIHERIPELCPGTPWCWSRCRPVAVIERRCFAGQAWTYAASSGGASAVRDQRLLLDALRLRTRIDSIKTAIPGPKSAALRAREDAHIARGAQGLRPRRSRRGRRRRSPREGTTGHRRRRQPRSPSTSSAASRSARSATARTRRGSRRSQKQAARAAG